MKYGCISIEKGSMNTEAERVINIGDHMQLLAILNLYHQMGIEEKDIVRIEYYDMFDYSGEEIVLPINFIWFNPFWGEKELILSENIHPVFLGIHSIGDDYNVREINYLKAHEPIGCRDAYTYQVFLRNGIDCYLQGCITSLFLKRDKEPVNGHVYMIDVQDELVPYIPDDIRENAIVLSHQYYGTSLSQGNWEAEATGRLKRYRDDASLVITSRLHCASPCMALGIPTIFAPAKKASSYSWISKILPVYDREQWGNINWTPEPASYENLKKQITYFDIERIKAEITGERIGDCPNFFEISDDLIEEYENGELMRIKQFTMSRWDSKNKVKYAIWGITQMAEHACKYIEHAYPNAELIAVYDNYRKLIFRGLMSQPISGYDAANEVYLLATGNSTSISAQNLFDDNGWDRSYLCTCYEGLHEKMEEDLVL